MIAQFVRSSGLSMAVTLLLVAPLRAATSINETNAYTYAANLGWIDFRGDSDGGAVIGEYVCSGSVWSANVGWISLGSGSPADGIQYGNDTAEDFGVNLTGHFVDGGVPKALLRGYAYGANIGWIQFESVGNPEISLATGALSGFAYSANCGWINLGDASFAVQTDTIAPGVDSDGDGIADAFELLHTNPPSLTVLTASGDRDGDGVSDFDEYLADTDPLDPNSYLHIADAAFTSTDWSLTWESSPARIYRIESKTDLLAPAWQLTLDNIVADGLSTTRTGSLPAAPQRFMRVRAALPLAP